MTIDFESFTPGTDISGMDLGGVVVTAGAFPVLIRNTGPGPSLRTISTDPFTTNDPFRADFTVGGVNSVSIDLGDNGADEDYLFLSAFDASDGWLGSDLIHLGAGVTALLPLSVASGSDIAYVLFGSIGP